MIRNFAMSIALLMGLAISNVSDATPITWSLSDVAFFGGGDASGTFVFDIDTGLYSDVSIMTTLGDGSVRGTYGNALGSSTELLLGTIEPAPPFLGRDILRLAFESPLTDTGGIIGLDTTAPPPRSAEIRCTNIGCTNFANIRVVREGSVLAVPEPATLSLLGLAFAGMGFARRRKLN